MRYGETPTGERGRVLTVTIALVVLLICASVGLSLVSYDAYLETRDDQDSVRAFYVADGALAEAWVTLADGGRSALDGLRYPRRMGGLPYWVKVTYGDADPSLPDDLIRLVATASSGRQHSRVVMVVRELDGPALGALGVREIYLDGGSVIDSYDSGGGRGEGKAARVASAGDVRLHAGSRLLGDVTVGPGRACTFDADSRVSGEIGKSVPDAPSPVEVPPLSGSGDLGLTDGETRTLEPGDYRYASLDLSGKARLTVRGPARIVVERAQVDTDAELLLDTAQGKVEVFVWRDLALWGGGTLRPLSDRPAEVSVSVAGDAGRVLLETKAVLVGRLYAPGRHVVLDDGAEVRGSVIAGRITLDGGSRIHVDEALFRGPNRSKDFERLAWRPLEAN